MADRIDERLMVGAARVAACLQQWVGIVSFDVARSFLLLATVLCLARMTGDLFGIAALASGLRPAIPVAVIHGVYAALLMQQRALVLDLKQSWEDRPDAVPMHLLVRIVMLQPRWRLLLLVVAASAVGVEVAGLASGLPLPQALVCSTQIWVAAAAYFVSVWPRPRGKSKARKFLESLGRQAVPAGAES